MKVTLTRRWGPYRDGREVEVDDIQGSWLIQHNYAKSSGDVQAPEQPAAAEGSHGADPLAGGDATRRRPRIPRSTGSTVNQAPGSSPTYRAGFDADASARQGEAGRPEDSQKPRRSRSKSEA